MPRQPQSSPPPDEDYEELERELKIDENSLEMVARDHPEWLYKVAKKLALAISRRDYAERELKELQSKVALDFRAEFRTVGAGRPTERSKA